MSRPSLSQLDLWSSHERKVLDVFTEALALLRGEAGLERDEIELNRKLFFCLRIANNRLWRAEIGGFPYGPVYEGKNPPSPDDERRVQRETKIPDFQWELVDDSAPDPRRGTHYF